MTLCHTCPETTHVISTAKTEKKVVDVRVEDHRIGQLTPQTSAKFPPVVRHLANRGLVTVGRGWFKGSSVSAQVSLMAAKAHELPDEFLTGDPKTVTPLNRARRTPVADAVAIRSVTADAPNTTFVIDMVTSQPLTPWQQKKALKLLRVATSVVGDDAESPVVNSNSIRAVVLPEHSDLIASAMAGIEDSDFSLANEYRASLGQK